MSTPTLLEESRQPTVVEAPRVYVVVRSDIPGGNRAAQIVHASQMSGAEFGCPDDCRVVVLAVKSEDALLRAAETLTNAGVRYCLFEETEEPAGYNALCTEPVAWGVVKLRLPLLTD